MRETVVVAGSGVVLVLVAIARGTWRDRRIPVGGALVLVGALAGFGATGRVFPGGPAIGLEAQVWMLLAGWIFVLSGWFFLAWAIARPRPRHARQNRELGSIAHFEEEHSSRDAGERSE